MSYAVSEALQGAIYQALTEAPDVAAIVGNSVFDAGPTGEVPDLYITLGPEDARARSDSTGMVTDHRLTIAVVGRVSGFSRLKAAAGAVTDCLHAASLPLARGRLVGLAFQGARARKRPAKEERRIDLTFRAIVEDNQLME